MAWAWTAGAGSSNSAIIPSAEATWEAMGSWKGAAVDWGAATFMTLEIHNWDRGCGGSVLLKGGELRVCLIRSRAAQETSRLHFDAGAAAGRRAWGTGPV